MPFGPYIIISALAQTAVRSRTAAHRARRARWTIALVASVGGCTAAGPAPSAALESGTPVRLCDGSDSVRFAGAVSGGGPLSYEQQILAENGFQYLIVQGTCDAWVLADIEHPLRHLSLSANDEVALTRDLRLGQWSEIATPVSGCPDASGVSLRFDAQRIAGVPCGAAPQSAFATLAGAFTRASTELFARGAEVQGDVRYSVVEGDAGANADATYRDAPLWPLAADIADVALTREGAFGYERGHSHRAQGDDAARLRALRASARDAGNAARSGAAFVPVLGPTGRRYEVYARDACPLEREDGLLVDVFE